MKREMAFKPKNEQIEQEPVNEKISNLFASFDSLFNNKLECAKPHLEDYKETEKIKNETGIIFKEILESVGLLLDKEKLSHEQTSDELLNLTAQLFRFWEIVSDTELLSKIFSDQEIAKILEIYAMLKNQLDDFSQCLGHKYKSTEVLAEKGKEASPLDIDFLKKTKKGVYGAMAERTISKTSNWIKNIQEKYIGGFAKKLTDVRFRSFVEKIAENKLTPKLVGMASFMVFGLLLANPFKETYADVEFSADNDPNNLDMKFDDGTTLRTATLQEFDTLAALKQIHSEKIDALFDYEFKFQGQGGFQEIINYELSDPKRFDYFLVKKTRELFLEKNGSFTKKDFQSLKPSDIYLISSIIMGQQINYSPLTVEKTATGQKELERIKKLPLDKAIMNGEKLACFGMASAFELISDRLVELSRSPFVQNLKFEELVVHKKLENVNEAHAMNIMIMKIIDKETGKPCLLVNFIPTTTIAKDKNTAIIKKAFIKSQNIILSEDERYNKLSAFLGAIDRQNNVFTDKEQEQIINFFKNNYPSGSTENRFVKVMLDKDFMSGKDVSIN